MPACLRACVPACLRAWLPACLHAMESYAKRSNSHECMLIEISRLKNDTTRPWDSWPTSAMITDRQWHPFPLRPSGTSILFRSRSGGGGLRGACELGPWELAPQPATAARQDSQALRRMVVVLSGAADPRKPLTRPLRKKLDASLMPLRLSLPATAPLEVGAAAGCGAASALACNRPRAQTRLAQNRQVTQKAKWRCVLSPDFERTHNDATKYLFRALGFLDGSRPVHAVHARFLC